MQVFSTQPAAVYTGIGHAFTRISSTEGLRALWRGVSSVIVGAGPAHAVHFGMYEAMKEFTGGNQEGSSNQWLSTCEWHVCSHPPFSKSREDTDFCSLAAVAGASATIASDALMNPFDGEFLLVCNFGVNANVCLHIEVIKQRMQVHQSEFRSMLSCATTVFRREGLSAFYVSYPTTLTMTVPFTAAQFTVYEQLKKFMNPTNTYSPISHIVSGGVAGGVAAALTTPLDVAKTLLQTRGTSSDLEIRNCRGMVHAFNIIWSRDGLRGFARGLTPRVVTHMPSNALCWLSYEFFSASSTSCMLDATC